MARLAIADPPYPPMFSERNDLKDGKWRLTKRSRATRWYYGADAPGRSVGDSPPADMHPDAGAWDDLFAHRELIDHLMAEFDGWAVATTPDGLGAYAPLPVSSEVLAWHRPTAQPGGSRLIQRWEPVIAFIPDERRHRRTGPFVPNVLTTNAPRMGFVGAKPPEWTNWVLDVLGFDPRTDEVVDLFPGSGSVAAAVEARRG